MTTVDFHPSAGPPPSRTRPLDELITRLHARAEDERAHRDDCRCRVRAEAERGPNPIVLALALESYAQRRAVADWLGRLLLDLDTCRLCDDVDGARAAIDRALGEALRIPDQVAHPLSAALFHVEHVALARAAVDLQNVLRVVGL